jgi:hypothetical protein
MMRMRTLSKVATLFMILPQAFAADCPPGTSDVTPLQIPKSLTDAACKAFNDKPEDIRQLVTKLVKAHLYTLDRTVYFYHYGGNDNAKADEPIDPNQGAAKYFKSGADSYFGKRDVKGGLYFAPDPMVSIDFSKELGLLLRIGVPPGTKYTDSYFDVSVEDGTRLDCYLESKCDSTFCSNFKEEIDADLNPNPDDTVPDGHGGFKHRTAAFSFSPDDFVEASPETNELMKGVFHSLGIAFSFDQYRSPSFPECPGASGTEAIFIDPDFATKADLKFLAPALESHPSSEKKKLYQDTLNYLDAFHFGSDNIEGGEDDSSDNFWEYYKAWAPVLENAPTDPTQLKAFQAKRSQDMKASRKALTSQLFGCNGDKNEVAPQY